MGWSAINATESCSASPPPPPAPHTYTLPLIPFSGILYIEPPPLPRRARIVLASVGTIMDVSCKYRKWLPNVYRIAARISKMIRYQKCRICRLEVRLYCVWMFVLLESVVLFLCYFYVGWNYFSETFELSSAKFDVIAWNINFSLFRNYISTDWKSAFWKLKAIPICSFHEIVYFWVKIYFLQIYLHFLMNK